MADERFYLHDVNGTGTWYDLTDYVVEFPDDLNQQAAGEVATLDIQLKSIFQGVTIPIAPYYGMECMLYDHDAHGTDLHEYHFAGVLNLRDEEVQAGGRVIYKCGFDGKEHHLNTHIPFIQFDEPTYPNDSSRVTRLITVATTQFGLTGTWDASTYVESGGFVTYVPGSLYGYPRKTVAQILDELRADPGQDLDNPVAVREFYVHGEWTDPTNVPASGITWYLHYYSATTVRQEIVPMTDRADKTADYVNDSFNRANSATSPGRADTSQAWANLIGTFGINGNQAYVVGSATQNISVVDASVYDCDVQVAFAQKGSLQRLAFRFTSLPATAYKGEGFIVQNEGGTGYSLFRYQGGVFTQLGSTYACTPANGDVIMVRLVGSIISVFLNGLLIISQTSSFNATATLHGLAQQGGSTARWDDFSVRATAAHYWNLHPKNDASNAINIQAIAGPGSDPVAVKWTNLVGVAGQEDGSLTKTLKPTAWAASTAYSTGDRRQPTKPNGRHYRLTSAGGTSGGTEPTWNLTEGASTTDGALTWVTEMWDAGATSVQPLTEDGGWVSARIEQVWKVSDNFDRPDDNAQVGQAGSGQDWAASGTNAVGGIETGKLKFVSVTTEAFETVDAGVSTGIVQAILSTAVTGARLIARYSDTANMYFLEAGATTYKLYKRVAGTTTQIGTVTLTPMDGDILKLVCSDQLLQFYHARSGGTPTFQFDATAQAANEGATRFGVGVTAAATAARFDDFNVWQTYSQMAFGLGYADTGQNYTDIEYGYLFKADRSVQPVESGVLVSAPFTYAADDAFKLEVRQHQVGTGTQPVVKYYRMLTSDSDWVEVYTSTVIPTISGTSPMYVDTAIYHAGATLSNVTMRRFTYGLYTDTRPGAMDIGPYPAKDTIYDDTLDSETKRKARAAAVFARHGPVETVTLDTLQKYTAGRTLLINAAPLTWVNRRMVIAHVKPDWRETQNYDAPLYHVTLGNRRREFTDKEPLGFLISGIPDSREGPAVPRGLVAADRDGGQDSPTTVFERVSWTLTAGAEQYIWAQLQRVGQDWQDPVHFSAERNTGVVDSLVPNAPYNVRIRAQGYNGQYSAQWSPAVSFVSAALDPAPAPTSITFPDEGVGSGNVGWLKMAWVHSTYTRRSGYRIERRLTSGATSNNQFINVPPDRDYVIIENVPVGVSVDYRIETLDEAGRPGPWSAWYPHTVAQIASTDINGSFERRGPGLLLPDGWTFSGDAVPSLSTTHVRDGVVALKVVQQAGQTLTATSTPMLIREGQRPRFAYSLWRDGTTINGVDMNLIYRDAAGSVISTYLVSFNLGSPSVAWADSVYAGPLQMNPAPAGTASVEVQMVFEQPGGSFPLTTWVDRVELSVDGTYQDATGAIKGDTYIDAATGILTTTTTASGGGKFTSANGYLVDSALALTTAAVSAWPYTAVASVSVIDGTTGATNRTLNLPAVAGCTGRLYLIKKVDSGVGTITIDGSGAETIDGQATLILTNQYSSVLIQSNGTEWKVRASYKVVAPNITATTPIKVVVTGDNVDVQHNTSGVSAATYTNATVAVNATGHITSASSGTAPVTSVTGTSPIVSSGGATPAISHAASGATANPYKLPNVTIDTYGHITVISERAGTSFPGSPSNNDFYYRTDLGVMCRYISAISSWVGPPIYMDMMKADTAPTYSATTIVPFLITPPDSGTYYFERVSWRLLVATTNNGSNYWTYRIGCDPFSGGGTVLLDVDSRAKTAGTKFMLEGTGFPFQPLNFTDGNQLYIWIEIRKDNGAPGNTTLYGCHLTMYKVYT